MGFLYELFYYIIKQIDRFVEMHFLLFYFSATTKAGFSLSAYAGGRTVAICFSAIRIVEKQVKRFVKMQFSFSIYSGC